ncbi:methyltransferase, FxLD system [Nocardiopsis sp. CNR-923]|uniref:methyltransferase, FxLD system n=1 Tax=Nocardiopsis sp. CNR-923 TaxID=1904965 RepID=UPI00373FD6E7
MYEPETHAFGGRAGMDLAHRLFHQESHHLLHWAARAHAIEPRLGRRELAVLLSAVFLRGTGLDWYEQGDVWARVADLRHRPAPFHLDTTLAQQVRTFMTTRIRPLVEDGPLQPEGQWVRELTEAGHALADLNRRGVLTRGLRAVLAHHLIFSFNRWGLPHRDQHILSNTAREVVMTDTTTPTADAATAARHALVDQLRSQGHIHTTRVAKTFRAVPRHTFVPNAPLEDAYAPGMTVSIKDNDDGRSISCASAPRIVAMMLEQAALEPGMRVLELGTGTGYNAALLAHLVGPTGQVVTIDVDPDVTDHATDRLKDTRVDNAQVVLGDGALGHPDGAPYDRIIATVGSHQIPAAWVNQLADDGRLIAPVRIAGDVNRSIVFERDGDHWVSVDSELATFMPLRDSIGDDTRTYVPVTEDGAVTIQANTEQHITPEQVTGVLDETAVTVWTGVTIGGMEPRDGLWLRLALALGNSLSRMNVARAAVDSGLVTPGLPWGDMASVPTSGRGLAYLTARRSPGQKNVWEFGVIGHAPEGQQLAEHMAAEIRGWDRNLEVSFKLTLDGEETVLTPLWH